MTIRTRFAPSPTGDLHIGGARTALFAWLFAQHSGGEFVLRIEDTDRERSTQASIDVILEAMQWLELDYAGTPVYQTQRFGRYLEVVDRLLSEGKAYYCYCSKKELENEREAQMQRGEKPRYNRCCRERTAPPEGFTGNPVVRFKNPLTGSVVFDDAVKGRIAISNEELDDLVISRPDGTPTYNFTVVVDDMDMQITHVIRGDDHVNNTPRQINIFKSLGVKAPRFAHVPMILGADGQRLSKRHGAVNVLAYRDQGILPEALCNYLVRLGWSHGDQEIFTRDQMIVLFNIEDVNQAAASFDPDKLLWLNQQYIKRADTFRLAGLLAEQLQARGIDTRNGPPIPRVAAALQERVQTIIEMADKSRCYFIDFENFEQAAADKHLRPVARELLEEVRGHFDLLDDWDASMIQAQIEAVADEFGVKLGKLAQPLRVAVTGGSASPPIDVTLELVGKERALERIDMALDYIDERISDDLE